MAIGFKTERKLVYGLTKKIEAIVKEETKRIYRIINTQSNEDGSGGFWAYDYHHDNPNHSVENWHYDVEKANKHIKGTIWNSTPPVEKFNYVQAIALYDLSSQTKSSDYKDLIQEYRNNVTQRIRQLGKYKRGSK